MSIDIRLDSFTGPMDLLLELIKKDDINICDIEISKITEDYLEIINSPDFSVENTADFIQMASYLIELKSETLLPKNLESDINYEDPRTKLIKALTSYKHIKELIGFLEKKESDNIMTLYSDDLHIDINIDSDKFKDVLISKDLLKEAYLRSISRYNRFNENHYFQKLNRDKFLVKDKQKDLLNILSYRNMVSFNTFISESISNSESIAAFLAILKLQQDRLVCAEQSAPFEDIRIRRNHG